MGSTRHEFGRSLAVVLAVALLLAGTAAPSFAHADVGVQPTTTASAPRMAQDFPYESCFWDIINEFGLEFFWAGYDMAYATDLALQGRYEEAYNEVIRVLALLAIPIPFECFPVRQVE